MFVYAKNWWCVCFNVTVNFSFNALFIFINDTSIPVREELA